MPRSLLLLLLLLPGCPSSSAPDAPLADVPSADDTPSAIDAPTSRDAPAPVDAPLDGAASTCAYVDTIDRSCSVDEDCVAVLHQTDCCGSSVMIGIRNTAYPEYGASEPACMASYPACECPAMLPTTDSSETVTDTSTVRAACVSRGPRAVCLTYITMRPVDGV